MVRQPGDRLKGIPLENDDDDDDQHDVVLMMMTLMMMIMLLMTMNTHIYICTCMYI